jgi:two-component system, sensor histidine kinase YesM
MKGALSRAFISHMNNVSIRIKLLFFFLLLSVIPFLVMTFLNNKTVSSEIKEQILFSADQVFNDNITMIKNKLDGVVEVSTLICLNDSVVQQVLGAKPLSYFEDYMLQNSDYRRLSDFLFNVEKYEFIKRVALYTKNNYFFSSQNVNFYSMDEVKESSWYAEVIGSSKQINWFSSSYFNTIKSDDSILCALRKIRNLDNLPEVLAIMRIDVDKTQITDIIKHSIITPHSRVILINSKDESVCTAGNPDNVLRYDTSLHYEEISKNYSDPQQWYTIRLVGSTLLMKSRDIPNTDWKMILLIPYADLFSASNKSRQSMTVIAIITSLAACGLAYILSYSLTKRIKQLILHMRKLETGNFDIGILPHSRDEIGLLQQNFNYMLTKLSTVMDEKLEMGKEIKNTDLKLLQAQINPHFLYNTLDLINWKAIDKNVPEISTLVQALAKYYRMSLGKGEDIVPLSDEIEHVKTYVRIQNERFQNRIHLDISIPESLKQFRVLKLLLQPLVENSILHGIMEKYDMEGTIRIDAAATDGRVSIRITDDGVGMQQSRLETLLVPEQDNKKNGYGIRNIHERIKLYYGAEYGLSYKSSLGSGTVAEITLPFQNLP